MPQYLIIDDLDSALALLPAPGVSAIVPAAEWVRAAVLEYAGRRGWSVIRHATFAKWAAGVMSAEQGQWIVLDPLLPVEGQPDRHSVRLSRAFDGNVTIVRSPAFIGDERVSVVAGGPTVAGVVDDAVASGRTLVQLSRMLASTGRSVRHVVTCASTRLGMDTVRARLRGPRWTTYLAGDWQVVHLRDGCPHVPLAGILVPPATANGLDGPAVELRLLSSSVSGHPWQALMMDRGIVESVRAAMIHVAAKLREALGRPATVGDLAALGPTVPAVVPAGGRPGNATELESLIPGPGYARFSHTGALAGSDES